MRRIRVKSDEYQELDNHYPRYHADKARRIKERGSKCCHTAPEAMDGAIELLEELYAPPSPNPNPKPGGISDQYTYLLIEHHTSPPDIQPSSAPPPSESITS